MDWDKLRIFHVVARAGSFTGAGDMLNLSQSAVSRQIATLEESLGVMLFHRHARGLILTEQGEILQKATEEIANQLQLIEGQLADTRQLPKGPLVVTVSDFIGTTWLAPRLSRFRELYPDIQLTILFEEKVLNLGMREADAAIRLHEPKYSDTISRKLTTLNFHICASQGYLDKYGYPASIRDLKNHCLLAFPPGTSSAVKEPGWLLELAQVRAETHNNIIMMNSLYAIYRAVRADAGIAVLPDYLIKSRENLRIVLPELQRPPIDLFFVYAEERRHSKRINSLRDFLLSTIDDAVL
jgi:DNA-binding transcriptional LysR family regulator